MITRFNRPLVLILILILVACNQVASEPVESPPNVATTAIGPLVSAVSRDKSPGSMLSPLEIAKVQHRSATATPAASVAPLSSDPVEPPKQIACGLDDPTVLPDLEEGDTGVLTGPAISEGTTLDKKPYLLGQAVSISLTFHMEDSGVRQKWSFQDEDGAELDSYGNLIDWSPHLLSDGNPALILDWDCHKNAWLTGGIPSFSYYARDYAVDERTLDSGMKIVLFSLDTTFYSSDEDLVRNKDVVYGYDKVTGRVVVMDEYEHRALDGVLFSLMQNLEMDVDHVVSSHRTPTAIENPTPTPTPTPAPATPVVTPHPQAGEEIRPTPASSVTDKAPPVDASPETTLTLEDC